jgi:spore germination protein GerM
LKQSIRLLDELKPEDDITSIKEIQEFYGSKEISKNVAARVIMLAYEFDILTLYKE